MTTITLTDARRDSLTAYQSIFADGCVWHHFATTTVVVAGNTVGAIASDIGASQDDYRSAVAMLTASGITQCREQAYDNTNGCEVFLFGAAA